jgi:hypothetical protein
MRKLCVLLLALCACTTTDEFISDGAAPLTDAGKLVDASGTTLRPRVVGEYKVVGSVKQFTGFYDTQLAQDCSIVLTTAGLRCVPSSVSLSVFSDAACTALAAYAVPPACAFDTAPAYGLTPLPACGGPQHVYTLRAVMPTPANYYVRVGAACSAAALPAGWTLYTAVSEIDPTTFAAASVER